MNKNKLYSSIMIALSALVMVLDNDATVFVLALMFGIPCFFSKKEWFI